MSLLKSCKGVLKNWDELCVTQYPKLFFSGPFNTNIVFISQTRVRNMIYGFSLNYQEVLGRRVSWALSLFNQWNDSLFNCNCIII